MRASFAARTFSAIIGQSGSGKTTLLNILSGRGSGVFRGSLAVNGAPNISHKALKHIASLVPQHDDMYDTLTARETLSIYAALRGSTAARVEYLLSRLGLAYAADVRIGNALRPGLSGGQRKRLSVAIELLDSPSVLFLDEPTTGLDSRNQAETVAFMRELADSGCTVVTTIHSPSEAVFRQFDHVLLLVRHVGVGGGSLAFDGGVADCDAWFALLGAPRPPHANPAEHALSCLDADYKSLSLPSLWRLRRLRHVYHALPGLAGADAAHVADAVRPLCLGAECDLLDLDAFASAVAQGGGTFLAFVNAMVACLLAADAGTAGSCAALGLSAAAPAPRTVGSLNAIALRMESSRSDEQPPVDADGAARIKEARPYATSGLTQWRLLLKREFLMLAHDRRQLTTMAAMSVIIPLFLGGMYFRIHLTQANFTNLVAALFLSCLFAGVLPLNMTMMSFPSEQVIIKREYHNGCFSSAAYYASKALFLSLTRGGQSVLVAMVIYFMAGVYPRPLEFSNVLVFFVTLVIIVVWSSCAGLAFGLIVPDAASAAAVSMPFVLIQVLFSGFYVTRAAIPAPLIWAYYVSFFRYSLAILVKNLFHRLRFQPCNGGFCPFGPEGSGRDVERQYGVAGDSTAMLFGVCIGYTALIIAVGYIALVLQLRSKLIRKAPTHRTGGGSLAERVLDLPPHALALLAPHAQPDVAASLAPATAAPWRRRLWRRCAGSSDA